MAKVGATADDELGTGEGKLTVTGLNIVSSDFMMRSGGSRTAESTMILVICCRPGVTSVGFQSSSSTNFADCVSRFWWNVCKKRVA